MNEFKLNNDLYKETQFQGYFVTIDGKIAQIKFEDDELKSFLLMRHEITKNGYHRIEINNSHKLVHRLVYEVFGSNKLNPELVIDHVDANTHNNHISNLRQVTQQENIQNATEHGNFGTNHNTKIKVFDHVSNTSAIYDSIKSFYIAINAPQYMINHGGLSCLKKRKDYINRFSVIKINEH